MVLLAATAALGQAGAISSQAQMIEIPDHPQHAALTPMACEHRLVGGASDNIPTPRENAVVGVRSGIGTHSVG